MLAFGLGTLPMMLMTGSAAAELKNRLQVQGWRTANGLLVVAFGVWTLWQAFQHGAGNHHHDHAANTGPQPAATTPAKPAAAGASPTGSAAVTPEPAHYPGMDMRGGESGAMPMDHSHHHDMP
jgi:ABC-type nickel/cobalt efflux system permease component RcnA